MSKGIIALPFASDDRHGVMQTRPTLQSHPDVLMDFSMSRAQRFDYSGRQFTMKCPSLPISTPMRNFVTGVQPTFVRGEHGKAKLSGTSYSSSAGQDRTVGLDAKSAPH